MSENKGKKGEMEVLELTTHLGRRSDCSIDPKRFTDTYTADMGVDLLITGDLPNAINNINPGAIKSFNNPAEGSLSKTSTMRIDVKNIEGKVGVNHARKFVEDTAKTPNIEGHGLIGGEGLTSAASKILEKAQEAYNRDKRNTQFFYMTRKDTLNTLNIARQDTIRQEEEEIKALEDKSGES